MSIYNMPPYTPLLYSKTGVWRDIPIFLIFAPKHRLWVLIRTEVLMCTHNLCFEKNKKNIKKILLNILIFYNFKNLCILHGRVFVMS